MNKVQMDPTDAVGVPSSVSLPFVSAPGSGGLREVLVPLRAEPSGGAAPHAQSGRQRPRSAQGQLPVHLAGDQVTPRAAQRRSSTGAQSRL